MAVMATTDDMEMAVDATALLQDGDDIDIDIDIEEQAAVNEDEQMGDEEGSLSYKEDDEMADDEPSVVDEIIEDAIDYDSKEVDRHSVLDEELQDAQDTHEALPLDDHTGPLGFGIVAGEDAVVDSDPSGLVDISSITLPREEPNELEPDSGASALDQSAQTNQDVVEADFLTVDDVVHLPTDEPSHPIDAIAETGEHVFEDDLDGVADKKVSEPVGEVLEAEHGDGGEKGRFGDTTAIKNVKQDSLEDKVHQESDEVGVEQPPQGETAELSSNEPATAASKPEDVVSHSNEDDANTATEPSTLHVTHDLDFIYQATIQYQDSTMSLFPPAQNDEEAQTYLLADEELAKGTLQELLAACRLVLGESISESELLEISIPSLGLSYVENLSVTSDVSLTQLIDIYSQLQHNDGVDEPDPLFIVLETRENMPNRLRSLYDAIEQGKGLSQIASLFNLYSASSNVLGEQFEAESFHEGEYNQSTTGEPGDVQAHQTYDEPNVDDGEVAATLDVPTGAESFLEIPGSDIFDFRSPKRVNKFRNAGVPAEDQNSFLGGNDTNDSVSTELVQPANVNESLSGGDDNAAGTVIVADTEPLISKTTGTVAEGHLEGPLAHASESNNETNHDSLDYQEILPEDGTATGSKAEDDPPAGDALSHKDFADDADNLDNIDDLLEPETAASSGEASSATITNDTNQQTMHDDNNGATNLYNVFPEDEISFVSDDDELGSAVAPAVENDRDALTEPSSASPGSLKRQRPAGSGENLEADSSLSTQRDAKRVRSDEES